VILTEADDYDQVSAEVSGLLRRDLWGHSFAAEAMDLPVNRYAKRLRRDSVIMPLSGQPFQSIVATCRPENVDSGVDH
jgi:hypothetical protein